MESDVKTKFLLEWTSKCVPAILSYDEISSKKKIICQCIKDLEITGYY